MCVVRDCKDIFCGLPIKVSNDENGIIRYFKIGNMELSFDIFDPNGDIKKEWEGVFEKDG